MQTHRNNVLEDVFVKKLFFSNSTTRIPAPVPVRAQPVSAFSFLSFPSAPCHGHHCHGLATLHTMAATARSANDSRTTPYPHQIISYSAQQSNPIAPNCVHRKLNQTIVLVYLNHNQTETYILVGSI